MPAIKEGRRYLYNAVVNKTISDNVTVGVWAKSLKEAQEKAIAFLEDFPAPANGEGIDYAYINNRETLASEVVNLKLQEKE